MDEIFKISFFLVFVGNFKNWKKHNLNKSSSKTFLSLNL